MIMILSSVLTFAQYARITDSGPVGHTSAFNNTRAVLYDQISNPGTDGGITAQDFEASFDIYDAEGADDFTVPTGEMWVVDNVQVLGSYSTTGPCVLANVRFYADNAGSVGALLFEHLAATATPDATGNLDISIPATALSAGTYWVSVQGKMDFGTGGQWYWSRQAAPTIGNEFMWRNPGDGFGSGNTSWVNGSVMWPSQTDYNLSFALNGSTGGSCTYQIALTDPGYGDGWNGGNVSVFVNGSAVLNNVTLNSGYGPVYFDFNASTGDEITTDYTAGGWSYENYYEILDPNGNSVFGTGWPNGTPADLLSPGITGNCPLVGDLEGFVYQTNGTPIQGATVQIEGVGGVPTDATGYYLFTDLQVEDYEVVCTAPGYSPEIAIVSIVAGAVTQHDFYLGQPNLTISPLLLENTLNPGEWFTDYIGMLNTGDGTAYWDASI
ncbi:MAG: hypothetical protein C0598_05775, partial [Marinilabiliales bacterium]